MCIISWLRRAVIIIIARVGGEHEWAGRPYMHVHVRLTCTCMHMSCMLIADVYDIMVMGCYVYWTM